MSYEGRKTSLTEDAPLFLKISRVFLKFQRKCSCTTIVFRKNYTATNDNSTCLPCIFDGEIADFKVQQETVSSV